MASTQHPTELEAAGDLGTSRRRRAGPFPLTATLTRRRRKFLEIMSTLSWLKVHGPHGPHALDPRGRLGRPAASSPTAAPLS